MKLSIITDLHRPWWLSVGPGWCGWPWSPPWRVWPNWHGVWALHSPHTQPASCHQHYAKIFDSLFIVMSHTYAVINCVNPSSQKNWVWGGFHFQTLSDHRVRTLDLLGWRLGLRLGLDNCTMVKYIQCANLCLVTLPDLQSVLYWPRCGWYYHPHLEHQPIRDQWSGHVISMNQSEISIQVTWSALTNQRLVFILTWNCLSTGSSTLHSTVHEYRPGHMKMAFYVSLIPAYLSLILITVTVCLWWAGSLTLPSLRLHDQHICVSRGCQVAKWHGPTLIMQVWMWDYP